MIYELFIKSVKNEELINITSKISSIIEKSEVKEGLCNIFVRHTTAGIIIQENWDDSVQKDILNFLKKTIPDGIWFHDKQDANGAAHLKSGVIGNSINIPFKNKVLLLGEWQNIFFCEFDGPRERKVIVTIIKTT